MLVSVFLAGAHVCVLAFSCVDKDSFLALENWKKKVASFQIVIHDHTLIHNWINDSQ